MLNIAQACPASIPWPSQLGQVESYNHLSLYYSLLALSIYSQFIIFQPKIKIMAQSFQDMILGVYQVHPHHHYDPWGLPSTSTSSWMTLSSRSPVRNHQHPPSTPFLTPHSCHTSKKDIDIKLSGYLAKGQIRSSLTSGVTMSSESNVSNHPCPPNSPFCPTLSLP